MKQIIHLLPNAHLDPVWLWDWREGLNEGIATCRTMLKLMREIPDMTFIKGECSVYEMIEKYDPDTFEELKQRVKEGRWEIVGGNVVQPDTNMCSTDVLMKQYQYGRRYFQEKFGVNVETAWAPDSFGHAAGFPEIYADSGFRYFSFTRHPGPQAPNLDFPLFRWCAPSGKSVLTLFDSAIHCYCTYDRICIPKVIEMAAEKYRNIPLKNVPFFMGMGDHGGGPSRRHIEELFAWADKHSDEFEVKFSTFHTYFQEVLSENPVIPDYTGELNACLRGCTASALRVKSAYRKAEAALLTAERVDTTIADQLKIAPAPKDDLWKGLLFNTFHDILPGSSIERALDEQQEWLNGIIHQSRAITFNAMNRLAQKISIRVPELIAKDQPEAKPLLIFNPRNKAYDAEVELEVNVDYRPINNSFGKALTIPVELLDESQQPIPYQQILPETDAFDEVWRVRVLTRINLPANGYRLLTLGYVPQNARIVPILNSPVTSSYGTSISNGLLSIAITPGDSRIRITKDHKPILAEKGLEFALFKDRFGAWGAMDENPEGWRANERLETWKATVVKVTESGPERASLFAVFEGAHSSVRVTFSLERGTERIIMSSQLIWQDRANRLKLVMDPSKTVTYQVPGGVLVRQMEGDVHCGRWQKLDNGWGIANDVINSSAQLEDSFVFTIVRGSVSSSGGFRHPDDMQERAITDYGAHRFTFVFAPADQIEDEADALMYAPVVTVPWAHL